MQAIHGGKNGYSPTQGIAALREKLQAQIRRRSTATPIRQVFVTSGTSGGLVLAMLALVNPGDEVIVFDPYFVMYTSLVGLVGGKCVLVDTYPDFRIDLDKVAAAITKRTKADPVQQPRQPDRRDGQRRRDARPGPAGGRAEHRAGQRRNLPPVLLRRAVRLAGAVTIRRRSSSTASPRAYGMTGWRLGFAHGPAEVIAADDQAAAVHVRLRTAAGAMGRRRGAGRRHDRGTSTTTAASAT